MCVQTALSDSCGSGKIICNFLNRHRILIVFYEYRKWRGLHRGCCHFLLSVLGAKILRSDRTKSSLRPLEYALHKNNLVYGVRSYHRYQIGSDLHQDSERPEFGKKCLQGQDSEIPVLQKVNPCVGPRMRFIRLIERQLIWADQKALSFFKMVVLIICIEISAAVETEVEQIAFPHRGAERIERRTLLPSAK